MVSTNLLVLAGVLNVVASLDCDPLTTDCPPNPAVNGTIYENFHEQPANWSLFGGPTYFNTSGLNIIVRSDGNIGRVVSNQYIMFGHVTAVVKHPIATGIASRIFLLSDAGDQIQFLWPSGLQGSAQAGYFGLKNSSNESLINVLDGISEFNTYEIDWTADRISWSINGRTVRDLVPTAVVNGTSYPQTPMCLTIEAFDAVYWGDVRADWSKGPYPLVVQSVQITDYSTGSYFSYSDRSGTFASIRSDNGAINSTNQPNTTSTTSSPASTNESTSMIGAGSTNQPDITSTTSSPASTNESTSMTGAGLTVTAKADIGVGVGIASLTVIFGAALMWWKRRTRILGEKQKHDPGVTID